jgi:hypothetical protein
MLVFITALYGCMFPDIYDAKYSDYSKYLLMGQDFFSILVAAILVIALFIYRKWPLKGLILWLGCLLYIIYVYAYYSMSGITTVFFLVYIVILSLSAITFTGIITGIDFKLFQNSADSKNPGISVSIFLIVCCISVGAMEIATLVKATFTDKTGSIKSSDIFMVFDLALLFPAIIITAINNLKKRIWAFMFSGIFLVKTAALLPSMVISDIFSLIYTGKLADQNFDIIATAFTVVSLFLLWLYFKNIKESA